MAFKWGKRIHQCCLNGGNQKSRAIGSLDVSICDHVSFNMNPCAKSHNFLYLKYIAFQTSSPSSCSLLIVSSCLAAPVAGSLDAR